LNITLRRSLLTKKRHKAPTAYSKYSKFATARPRYVFVEDAALARRNQKYSKFDLRLDCKRPLLSFRVSQLLLLRKNVLRLEHSPDSPFGVMHATPFFIVGENAVPALGRERDRRVPSRSGQRLHLSDGAPWT
jgi:hypothetical protein